KANILNVNVGGVVFETTRQTITQQKGSLLDEIFSGRHSVSKDLNGNIFLDRDPHNFRVLLNYLRDPTCAPIPRDDRESFEIYTEAKLLQVRLLPHSFLFVIGGHSGHQFLSSVELYDSQKNTFIGGRHLETERAYAGGESLSNRIISFGGQNLNYKALADTEIFDVLRDCWTSGPPLNTPRRNVMSACLDDNVVYCMGGYDGRQFLSSVECYDIRTLRWMKVGEMPSPVSSASTLTHDGRVFILGGTEGSRSNAVHEFDPRMNRWQTIPSLQKIRSASAAVTFLGHYFVFGGADEKNDILNSVEYLVNDGKQWKDYDAMPDKRMEFTVNLLDDTTLMLVGGVNKCEILDSSYFFKPESCVWEQGPPLNTPRCGHSSVLTAF
ncbi:kelch repeat and K+ channel tetramerization domain containing protein, partial [Cardiosporidium cionae]